MANASAAVMIAVDNDASLPHVSSEDWRQNLRMVEALLFATAEPVAIEDIAAVRSSPVGSRVGSVFRLKAMAEPPSEVHQPVLHVLGPEGIEILFL